MGSVALQQQGLQLHLGVIYALRLLAAQAPGWRTNGMFAASPSGRERQGLWRRHRQRPSSQATPNLLSRLRSCRGRPLLAELRGGGGALRDGSPPWPGADGAACALQAVVDDWGRLIKKGSADSGGGGQSIARARALKGCPCCCDRPLPVASDSVPRTICTTAAQQEPAW